LAAFSLSRFHDIKQQAAEQARQNAHMARKAKQEGW
jgi:hypothetical protein